jgi:hypothetical protein
MKSALYIDLGKLNRQVVVVIDSCSTEELETLATMLRRSDPSRRTYWKIEQSVTCSFDELLTVMLPSAGLVDRAISVYIQVEQSKIAAKKFRESGGKS